MRPDHLDDAIKAPADVLIRETQYLKPAPFETSVAYAIMGDITVSMLRSVELNDAASFEADEIDRVESNGCLPTELVATELPPAQSCPEVAFGVCRVATELAGQEDRV